MQDARRFSQQFVAPIACVVLKGIIHKHDPWPLPIDKSGICDDDDIVQALDAGL